MSSIDNVQIDNRRWMFIFRPTHQLKFLIYPDALTYHQASQHLAGHIHGAAWQVSP